jgi:hypothetical protein
MAKKKKFEPGRDLYNELRAARAKATPNPTLGIAALALFAPINPLGTGNLIEENQVIAERRKSRVLICDGCNEPIPKVEVNIAQGFLSLDYHTDRDCVDLHHANLVSSFIKGDNVEIGLPLRLFGCAVSCTDQ